MNEKKLLDLEKNFLLDYITQIALIDTTFIKPEMTNKELKKHIDKFFDKIVNQKYEDN